jgi:phosphatidate phosphatase APP1
MALVFGGGAARRPAPAGDTPLLYPCLVAGGRSWQDLVLDVANGVDAAADRIGAAVDAGLGRESKTLSVIPYRGFGTPHLLVVKGRVLHERGVRPPRAGDGRLRNLINMYHRFESEEVAGARVGVSAGGVELEATADGEGYFEAALRPVAPVPPGPLWQPATVTLLYPLPSDRYQVAGAGQVLVPPEDAELGVISDVDDTVVRTEATRLLRMARLVFLSNARTRLPFPGAATLYQALHRGRSGRPVNPVFYVSSSPWNLYDLLDDFLSLRGFPAGPLFLRDWGIRPPEGGVRDHRTHKLATIRRLLDVYPRLPFLLIGDSGQSDPEIYAEVVRDFPGRVPAVYIRDVSRTPQREAAIAALARAVTGAGSTLLLARDSYAVARDAAARGWIAARAPADVAADSDLRP